MIEKYLGPRGSTWTKNYGGIEPQSTVRSIGLPIAKVAKTIAMASMALLMVTVEPKSDCAM